MEPTPTRGTPPVEEQTAAAVSGSALSQWSVTPSVSSAGVSSRGTLASGTLRIVIPISEAESSADEIKEMSVPASPPRLPISQGLATGSMTHAVTKSVIYRQQREDEAAASSSRSQEDELSGRQSPGSGRDLMPLGTDCQESKEGGESDPEGARPRVGQDAVIPVETRTWDEMEDAVWQSVRGTSEGAMGYALAVLDRIWTDVEEGRADTTADHQPRDDIRPAQPDGRATAGEGSFTAATGRPADRATSHSHTPSLDRVRSEADSSGVEVLADLLEGDATHIRKERVQL